MLQAQRPLLLTNRSTILLRRATQLPAVGSPTANERKRCRYSKGHKYTLLVALCLLDSVTTQKIHSTSYFQVLTYSEYRLPYRY